MKNLNELKAKYLDSRVVIQNEIIDEYEKLRIINVDDTELIIKYVQKLSHAMPYKEFAKHTNKVNEQRKAIVSEQERLVKSIKKLREDEIRLMQSFISDSDTLTMKGNNAKTLLH